MIPKVIHYCWFGNNQKTSKEQICIDSWKKYFPGYEIKEWNESNFDVNCCSYVKEAYQSKKWAFVSDYARFWILYNYGGVYFDTDVEIIKPMEDILAKGPFMGCEPSNPLNNEKPNKVAPGLGLAANPGLGLAANLLKEYNCEHFINEDKSLNLRNVVERTTSLLVKDGFKGDGLIEFIDGIYIYPPEYFCPFNFYTGEYKETINTRSIHHYSASWFTYAEKKMNEVNRKYISKGRPHCLQKKIVFFPYWVLRRIEILKDKKNK